ncbi:MAG TPA: hypothetical protein VFP55_11090 [Solirubrobacteraceae bacterium]|nr:hypothetical protein [Solirubrobacteraceae bacterium]
MTPEPERELPLAAATLRAGARPGAAAVAAELARIEGLLLHGTQRGWLAYLHEVTALIDASHQTRDPFVRRQRERAVSVLANHHNLLLGLPGRGARWTEADRVRLNRTAATI